MPNKALALLLTIWLAAGLGGKSLRYLPDHESLATVAEKTVADFLAREGWRLESRVPLTRAALYTAQVFSLPGCSQTLAVVVLGRADEASSLVHLRLGTDVAYIHAGQAGSSADHLSFLVHAWQAVGILDRKARLPVIAVSPAPSPEDAPCRPPALARWAAALGS